MDIQNGKKTILLHSCCGPCSSAVIERLAEEYNITVFFYNPNITEQAEYRLRLDEEKRFLADYEQKTGIHAGLLEGPWDPERFFEIAKGLEDAPEGGARCRACYLLRMEKTAKQAKALGFDCFDSTLSVSPYKNSRLLKELGEALAAEYGVAFAAGNYKKQNGYGRSLELSREYGLYRQDYCGCIFSQREAEARRTAK